MNEPQPLTIEALQRAYEHYANQPSAPRYEFTFRCTRCRRFGFAAIIIAECPYCGSDCMMYADRNNEHLGWYKASDLIK